MADAPYQPEVLHRYVSLLNQLAVVVLVGGVIALVVTLTSGLRAYQESGNEALISVIVLNVLIELVGSLVTWFLLRVSAQVLRLLLRIEEHLDSLAKR